MVEPELEGMTSFLYEMGQRPKQTGWWLAGIKDSESIASTASVQLIGSLI